MFVGSPPVGRFPVRYVDDWKLCRSDLLRQNAYDDGHEMRLQPYPLLRDAHLYCECPRDYLAFQQCTPGANVVTNHAEKGFRAGTSSGTVWSGNPNFTVVNRPWDKADNRPSFLRSNRPMSRCPTAARRAVGVAARTVAEAVAAPITPSLEGLTPDQLAALQLAIHQKLQASA